MSTSDILEAIDQQISQLQQVRSLLTGAEPAKRGPGRPKNTEDKPASAEVAAVLKRTMSEEGRARIAAAQKARWAKQHAAQGVPSGAAKKSSAKKASKAVATKATKGADTSAKKAAKAPAKKSAAKSGAKKAAAPTPSES